MGPRGSSELRLARVRLPGVQRTLELRPGQMTGTQPGRLRKGPHRVPGSGVPSARSATRAGTGRHDRGGGGGGRTPAPGAGPAYRYRGNPAPRVASEAATASQGAAQEFRRWNPEEAVLFAASA